LDNKVTDIEDAQYKLEDYPQAFAVAYFFNVKSEVVFLNMLQLPTFQSTIDNHQMILLSLHNLHTIDKSTMQPTTYAQFW
jgi:hypothetical protein